jgi:hypothetical protein
MGRLHSIVRRVRSKRQSAPDKWIITLWCNHTISTVGKKPPRYEHARCVECASQSKQEI